MAGQSIVEGQVQRNSGCCARNRGIAEARKKLAAAGGAVRRNAVFHDARAAISGFATRSTASGAGQDFSLTDINCSPHLKLWATVAGTLRGGQPWQATSCHRTGFYHRTSSASVKVLEILTLQVLNPLGIVGVLKTGYAALNPRHGVELPVVC